VNSKIITTITRQEPTTAITFKIATTRFHSPYFES